MNPNEQGDEEPAAGRAGGGEALDSLIGEKMRAAGNMKTGSGTAAQWHGIDAVDSLMEEQRKAIAGKGSSPPAQSVPVPPVGVLEDTIAGEKTKEAPKSEKEAFKSTGDKNDVPGAHSIAGYDAGVSRPNESTVGVALDVQDQWRTQVPPAVGRSEPSDPQVHAYVVENEEVTASVPIVDESGSSPPPQEVTDILHVEAKAVEYKPWYRRRPLMLSLFGLVLLVVGAIVMAVTLSSNDDTTIVVASESPTSSPAPTSQSAVSMVVQLDENPAETGLRIECDGEVLLDVPEGTYAFLPIGVLIPSYRVELTVPATVGSQCIFTITDAGGDGLIGGFYDIIYGYDPGNVENSIQRGVPLGATTRVPFEVIPPETDPPSMSSPTTSPATLAPTDNTDAETCSVCVDGSAVPDPSAIAPNSTMTCGELDDMARAIALNSSDCPGLQQLATGCGCTNFCDSICPDGSALDPSVEDKPVRVDPGGTVTCLDIDNQVMSRNSSADVCLSANFLGESVCECPGEGNFCRICQGGFVPGNLTKEIIPGMACGDISGIAYSLLRSDPRFGFICPACLSIGEYCGCPAPAENPRVFCRLCGDKLLPDTDRIVFSPLLGIDTTCFHIEFHSNLGITPNGTTSVIPDCSVVQEQSSGECCVE